MAYWVLFILFVGVVFSDRAPIIWRGEPRGPTVEELAVQLEEMSVKYNTLQRQFEDVLKSNTDLQATVVYQASRLQQIQKVVEKVPAILQDRHVHSERILSLEARLAEMEVTCAETCGTSRIGASVSGPDDWYYQIDQKAIEYLRKQFETANVRSKAIDEDDDEYADNYEYNDVIDETAIHEMSHALAQLVNGKTSDSVVDDKSDLPSKGGLKQTKTKSADVISAQNRAAKGDDVENQIEGLLKSAAKSGKKMVFSVGLTRPILGNADNPQTIVFDELKVKRGKGYDVKKGVFKCLIPGVYYFSFTLRSYDGKHIGAALMINNNAAVTMTTDAAQRQVMQSQSVIVKLVKNDEVWVMLGPNEDYAIDGRKDYSYNIFNGLLLFPEK